MSNLAAYRTAVLALLADASKVVFTDADVDQALRWALAEYSDKRPLIRSYFYDVDTTTAFHILPADFVTRHIVKVEIYNADPDAVVGLAFRTQYINEQWLINTKFPVEAGEVLQVSYSTVHAIDDLDASAGTTVPDADEILLQLGAAGHAALMRALNRVETINMNPDVVKAYRETAANYLSRFAGLLSAEPGAQVGLPEFPGDDLLSKSPSRLVF